MNRPELAIFSVLLLIGGALSIFCALSFCAGCGASSWGTFYCLLLFIFAAVLLMLGFFHLFCAVVMLPECKVCGRELEKRHIMIRNFHVCKTCYRNIRNRLNRESRLCFTNLDVLFEKQKHDLRERGLAK